MIQNKTDSDAITGRLDESEMRLIIRQKRREDLTDSQVAESMRISTIWFKKMWADKDTFPYKRQVRTVPMKLQHKLSGKVRVCKDVQNY